MFKIVLKSLVYFLFFIVMILLFIPKENLFFLVQKKIQPYKIELVSKSIKEDYFSLILDDIDIKFDNIEVSTVSNIQVKTYLYLTTITIDNIKVNSIAKKFLPTDIKNITFKHTMSNPTIIDIKSIFKDGNCTGTIDILKQQINLKIHLNKILVKKLRSTIPKLTKDKTKKGEYLYEYKF